MRCVVNDCSQCFWGTVADMSRTMLLPTDNVNPVDESLQHPIPSGPTIVLEESTVNERLPRCCHDDPVQGCTDAELEVGDFELEPALSTPTTNVDDGENYY